MTVMELELRPRGVQEAETYFERSGDAEICRMLPRTVTTLQEALANYRASQLPGAASFGRSIYLDGRHVGDVWCYCMEPGGEPEAMVSFCIFEKNCWGKGIASRAVEEFLAEVRDRFGLKRIGAFVYADNAASLRVLQKNGFICRERFVEDGRESCYLERES